MDAQLRARGSRLLVLRGTPADVLGGIFAGSGPFQLRSIFWDVDTEPSGKARDEQIEKMAADVGVRVSTFTGLLAYSYSILFSSTCRLP